MSPPQKVPKALLDDVFTVNSCHHKIALAQQNQATAKSSFSLVLDFFRHGWTLQLLQEPLGQPRNADPHPRTRRSRKNDAALPIAGQSVHSIQHARMSHTIVTSSKAVHWTLMPSFKLDRDCSQAGAK